MPKIILSSQHVAMVRVLAGDNWTHARIAALLGVERSTVTFALNHRKDGSDTSLDEMVAGLLHKALTRAHRVASLAAAAELQRVADELETANPATP